MTFPFVLIIGAYYIRKRKASILILGIEKMRVGILIFRRGEKAQRSQFENAIGSYPKASPSSMPRIMSNCSRYIPTFGF